MELFFPINSCLRLDPTGKDCQWIDACTSQPCANGSTCTVSGNKFSCICLSGYTGQKCEIDVNECATSGLCQHGGTCVNVPGSYRCQCKPGYTGHRCESTYVPCSPSPCMNGGTCHQTSDFTFECNCLPGKLMVLIPSARFYSLGTVFLSTFFWKLLPWSMCVTLL